MNPLSVFLLILLLIVLVPIAVAVLIFYGLAVGFEFLDFSLGVALMVLVLMFFASYINIPLGRHTFVLEQESRFFGLIKRPVWKAQGISVNVGGAIIPLFIAGYFLAQIYIAGFLEEFIITMTIVAVLSLLGSCLYKLATQRNYLL